MHYKITFPADYQNIAPLRDLAYQIAKRQGFSEQKSERLRAVLDEMANNAVEYGSQQTSEVTLEIFADETAIKIACHDQGHGNKLKAEQIKNKLSEELPANAPRGRGIRMIIKAFTDEFDLSDREGGGITATAVIKK